jgi:hypothetical protein
MKFKTLLISSMCITILASEKDKDKDKPLFTPDEMRMIQQGGTGSDIGMKAGLVTVAYIGKGLASFGASIKGGAVAAAAWVKGTAVAVAAAPATPYVAGGAAVTYGGYKTYRYFYPTKEEQAKSAERERKKQEDLEQTEIVKCRRERAKSVQGLRDCVSKYRRSTSFTRSGLPAECSDREFELALHDDGDSEVVKMAKRFIAHQPIKKDDGK